MHRARMRVAQFAALPVDEAGCVVERRREPGGDVRQRQVVGAGAASGAKPAEKIHPHPLLHPLDPPNEDRADLRRGADVCAAAGTLVEVGDGDEAQYAGAITRLPEPGARWRRPRR